MNNKKKLATYVFSELNKRKRRPLQSIETTYISRQLEKINMNQFNTRTLPALIDIIEEDINDSNKMKLEAKYMDNTDLTSYYKKEIGDETSIEKQALHEQDASISIQQSNIDSIFGTRDSSKLLKIFNPTAMVRKTYIVLDRRYQAKDSNNETHFKWNLSYHSGVDEQNTVVTRAPLSNICGMRMFPFRFPNTPNTITFPMRLSVNVEEIASQAFISPGTNRQFQFLFGIAREGDPGSLEPYQLSDIGEVATMHWFYHSIQYLESITLTFGNPFNVLALHPDVLPATISATGVQTLLTFSQPHFMAIDEKIIIENFNTDQPSADYVEINLINNKFGWAVAASTATTLTIDVDISGLDGVITGNPINIYLESKRFVIPIEIFFIIDK